ncbi:MAG: CRTAC1 family protein [Gammaproteobacteria bacterium]|nr:CRTAC1 family protein [Gammaproteobacteria bacterium]
MRIFDNSPQPDRLYRLTGLLLACVIPFAALADIRFEESSLAAGIHFTGPSAGSSWGDFDNDGWPDLWVSNHHGIRPSLYLNLHDGTFANRAADILVDDAASGFLGPNGKRLPTAPAPDFHGAAWADFDGDGDQDLVVVTGGGAGRGASANRLFINEDGKLTNLAGKYGVDYSLGRGRTPLWLDIDQDGKLDLLLMNHPRVEAPSAIFLQTSGGFSLANKVLGFPQPEESFLSRAMNRVRDYAVALGYKKPGAIKSTDEFAQLADLTGDGHPELIAYMRPGRIYGMTSTGLRNADGTISLPNVSSVQDAVLEDLNGDGRPDWYLVRSRPWATDVVQTDATHLQGNLANKPGESSTIAFISEGSITVEIHRPWMDPSDPASANRPMLYLGERQQELPEEALTVSPDDESIGALPPAGAGEGIFLHYDRAARTWTLRSSIASIGYKLASTEPVSSIHTEGFKPSNGRLEDRLLINDGKKFTARKGPDSGNPAACSSVAAGDFDNDMDIDLYLVCSDPTQNQPNILYENDGKANFTRIEQAGGAAGSERGRGNQVSVADYDRDGFLDLFVTNGLGPPPFADGPHQLFRNLGNDNHWIEIDLAGTTSNRDGIGALLTLETGGKSQTRTQGGGMHSFSQNHSRIHFGLGANSTVDRLTIRWPGGTVQELRNLQADRIVTVTEAAR